VDALLEVVEELSGIPQSKLIPATVELHSLEVGMPRTLRSDTQIWVFEVSDLASNGMEKSIIAVQQHHRDLPRLDKCRNCGAKVGAVSEQSPEGDEDTDAKKAMKRCVGCKQVGYCSQVRLV
jgi:hypothetical protein